MFFIYLFHKGLTFIFKRVNRNPIMVLCCLFCIEPIHEASIMITWCSRRPNELNPYSTLLVACRGFGTVVRTLARNWHLWIFNFTIPNTHRRSFVDLRCLCAFGLQENERNKRELNYLFQPLQIFIFFSSLVFVYDMAFLLIKMMSCQFLILLYKPYKF